MDNLRGAGQPSPSNLEGLLRLDRRATAFGFGEVTPKRYHILFDKSN